MLKLPTVLEVENMIAARSKNSRHAFNVVIMNNRPFCADKRMIPVLKALNEIGLKTSSHCEGDPREGKFAYIRFPLSLSTSIISAGIEKYTKDGNFYPIIKFDRKLNIFEIKKEFLKLNLVVLTKNESEESDFIYLSHVELPQEVYIDCKCYHFISKRNKKKYMEESVTLRWMIDPNKYQQ